MNKRILALIGTATIGTSLIAGSATYALFTASTSSNSSSFQSIDAGNVKLVAYRGGDNPSELQGPMFYPHTVDLGGYHPYDYNTGNSPDDESPGEWAPGDQVTRTLNIENKGSQNAKVTRILANLDSLKNQSGGSLDSTTSEDFLNHMKITVLSPDNGYSTPVYSGSLQQLVNGNQFIYPPLFITKGTTSYIVKFVASMDISAGKDLQGVTGVFDFVLTAEQIRNNWFDPPFSNLDYSMQLDSTTPIKFGIYDSSDNLITSQNSSVQLVISGPTSGPGSAVSYTFSMSDGTLTFNGGHYQANFDPTAYPLVSGDSYTATVYNGSTALFSKTFSTVPGNRSNSP